VVHADRGHRPRPGSSAEQARSRDHDARDERGQTAEQHNFLENTAHDSPTLLAQHKHTGTGNQNSEPVFFVPSNFKGNLNGGNISRYRLGIRHSRRHASPISTKLLHLTSTIDSFWDYIGTVTGWEKGCGGDGKAMSAPATLDIITR
jgi:hypothetical protein